MSSTTEADEDGTRADLRRLVFHEACTLTLVLEPDGRLRKVLESHGVDGIDRYSFGGKTIVDVSRTAEDGEKRAAEWVDRLALLQSGVPSVEFVSRLPGVSADQPATVECRATPIPGPDGTLDAILLQAEDCAGQYRVADRLRESEERFRALAETLPQMVWIADSEASAVYFSPQWERFTGRTEAELLGRGYRDLIHPDDLTQIRARRDVDGEYITALHRMRRHDGAYRWMEADYRSVLAEDGRVVRWVGGTTDVTERRERDDAERELQEQLRVALAVTGMGTYTVYFRDGRVVGDARLSEILGVDLDAMARNDELGQLFDLLGYPDDAEHARVAIEVAAAGGPDLDIESRMWRPGGPNGERELRWIAARGRVEFDENGPVRMVGVVEDITQRRTEEEERLRWQKRDLIGTLAGGIAHDFNNVISAILSNAALAGTELDLGRSPATSISEISRGAERAARLVRRLLEFSREGTEGESPRAVFDLGAVVAEACGLVAPSLPRDGELKRSIASDLPPIRGSASELHRVVVNLLTNAGHAIEGRAGTVQVTVDMPEAEGASTPSEDGVSDGSSPPRGMIRIQVQDDGPGIPEPVLGRIFDPFFTTKPAGKGTGLGLAAARTIVRSHGGTVAAENVDGGGARFTVLLPQHVANDRSGGPVVAQPDSAAIEDAPEGSRSATPRAAELAGQAGASRLMFVDDEAPLTRLAERALPALGYIVQAFTDPQQALDTFRAAPDDFDALITDLSMPGLSGLELIEQIRVLRPDLPVVLSSGFLTTVNREQAERQRVDAIVPKPCSLDDLDQALRARLT